jgi:hypothetical protein
MVSSLFLFVLFVLFSFRSWFSWKNLKTLFSCEGLNLGKEMKEVLVTVANSIPTQQAPVWLNWIIVRFTYTLPFMYLFQANTFGFSIIRWAWCGRLMRGG